MAMDFPANPVNGQIFTVGEKTWLWDGTSWNAITRNTSIITHGGTHGVGGVDAVTVAQSQVTNLTTDLAAKAPLASPSFTGNVGIGTSSPLAKLDVAVDGSTAAGYNLRLTNPSTAAWSDSRINFVVGSSVYGDIVVQKENANDSASIILNSRTAGGFTEKVRITSNGNFGIGTASPAYKLDVNGSLNATSFYLNGTSFRGGATGGGTDDVFYENGQTVNTSYTITTNKNAMTAGPVSVANGVTVTVPNGSTWTVV